MVLLLSRSDGQHFSEEGPKPQHIRADHERRPPAGLHRGAGSRRLVGADGLQRLVVLSPPQEEAAGPLHHILRLYTSR